MDDIISYMGYQWLTVEDGLVTVGINEDSAGDLSDDLILNLPEQDDIVMAGKICGDIESENGNLNIYSPVSGTIVEVNETILDNPSLILEDPVDEGWLFKVEADDPSQIDRISLKSGSSGDDDMDDDEDDEDNYDEDEEDYEDGDDA